jgi:dihydropteroate synthase
VAEVKAELSARADAALAAGIARENIVLDPGFGFAKNAAHNLELLRRLRELTDLGYPLLAGWSRKSTIGKVLGGPPVEDRLEGTAATVALSIAYGAAIVRVHDVREMARVARMTDAVVRGNWEERDSEFGIRNSEEGRTT